MASCRFITTIFIMGLRQRIRGFKGTALCFLDLTVHKWLEVLVILAKNSLSIVIHRLTLTAPGKV